MNDVSHVYDVPALAAIDCRVKRRVTLPDAVIELHHYRFHGPQDAVFQPSRCFLDLALSPRPGIPRGAFMQIDRADSKPLGDVMFVPAGSRLQSEWGAGEQISVCCGFDSLSLEDEDVSLSGEALEAALDVRSIQVRDALLRIAREMETPGFCSDMLVQAMWVATTIDLHRYLRRPGAACGPAASLSRTQMQRINELVEQPGKLPSVAQLADLCGLSTRHFFRLFRAATGKTLSDYVAERRIDRAKQMLGSHKPAIKVIAWECGFETSAAFSAAFRKAVGVTPTEFRQAILN